MGKTLLIRLQERLTKDIFYRFGYSSRNPFNLFKKKGMYVGWVHNNNFGDEVIFENTQSLFDGCLIYVFNPSLSNYGFGVLGGHALICSPRLLKENAAV